MALIKHLREYRKIVITFENKVTITMVYFILEYFLNEKDNRCYFNIIT
jgi:hypothetical protein